MMPSARLAPATAPHATAATDAPANDDHGHVVQLRAHRPVPARMQETLHAALQLVSRLCDRGISERERTDCALRARGSLRLLDQMLAELPGALAAAPVHRQRASATGEDA